MNPYTLLGSILAIVLYFPLWRQIKSGLARQNLLTWALWCILDAVVAASIVSQEGSWLLVATYTVGSFITVLFIWNAGERSEWTWIETMVMSSVFASMVVWYISGDRMATIASTVAVLIASMPQLLETFKNPKHAPVAIYFGYFVASCLSAAGGSGWSVKERMYPVSVAILSICMTAFAARKFVTAKNR